MRSSRRGPVGLALLFLAAALPGCSRPAGSRAPGSPVILVSVDTLRSDRLSPYGYRGIETLAFEALAQDSVLYEHAYSHYPVTLPAHASMLTGLLPPDHGVRNNKGYALEEELDTLAERLRRAGYRTAGFVSSMVLGRGTGIAQGFDVYDEPSSAPGRAPRVFAQQRGDVTLARVRSWLAGVRPDERFFLFLHLFDPHTPYDAPEPYASRAREPYDAEVAWVDHLLAGFLADLRRLGMYDRSAILLLSDHGEGLGDHVEREHGVFLYREAIQVPFMVKLPGGKRRGERVAAPAALVDVVPTVLALLGLPREGLPGRALLEPGEPPAGRVIYGESFFGLEQYGWSPLRSAVRESAHYIQAPRPELYDLARDPAEKTNLLPGRPVPAALASAVASAGPGKRSLRPVSREAEERLASLGYVGGPVPADEAEGDRPDPKDGIAEAMELWALMDEVGRTDSAAPELRIKEILGRLHVRREPLSRTVALNLLRAGRAQAAAEVLQPFADSAAAETQLTLGEIAAVRGRSAEARRRFHKVLELDPRSAEARKDMGILLLGEGRPAEARRWLEQAVDLDERQAEAWNGLGVVRARAGDPRGAVEAWRRAVDLDPGLGDAWFNLAVTLRRLGDGPAARAALERYLPLVEGAERARALALLRQLVNAGP